MSTARELAEFLTRTTIDDLPAQAVDYAAMLIASTIASAATGRGIKSATIVRDMARERGGRRSLGVVRGRREIAGHRRGAGQRSDERCGSVRRQRSAQHRALRHAADRDVAGDRGAAGRERRRRAGGDRARLRGWPDGSSTRCRMRGCAGFTVRRARSSPPRGRPRCCCGSMRSKRRTRSASPRPAGGLAKAADTSVAREYNAATRRSSPSRRRRRHGLAIPARKACWK